MLPFQAAIALYFISRHLGIRPTEMVRATQKSGMVTACTITGAMLGIASAGLVLDGQLFKLLCGGILATLGWTLGLLMTNHPLLTQVRLAASSIGAVASRFPVLGQWAAAMHSWGKVQ
jgi:hypothetical protein